MPVRSSRSSVLRWPDRAEVMASLAAWAETQVQAGAKAVGCFGSYARGDQGVGSDLDLVILVEESDLALVDRGARYDTLTLPVPVDLLVYTCAEWRQLVQEGRRITGEVRWLAWAGGG